jgi:hypothetical protein
MWHVWLTVGVFTRFWWGNRRERVHLEKEGLKGKIIGKYITNFLRAETGLA